MSVSVVHHGVVWGSFGFQNLTTRLVYRVLGMVPTYMSNLGHAKCDVANESLHYLERLHTALLA